MLIFKIAIKLSLMQTTQSNDRIRFKMKLHKTYPNVLSPVLLVHF